LIASFVAASHAASSVFISRCRLCYTPTFTTLVIKRKSLYPSSNSSFLSITLSAIPLLLESQTQSFITECALLYCLVGLCLRTPTSLVASTI